MSTAEVYYFKATVEEQTVIRPMPRPYSCAFMSHNRIIFSTRPKSGGVPLERVTKAEFEAWKESQRVYFMCAFSDGVMLFDTDAGEHPNVPKFGKKYLLGEDENYLFGSIYALDPDTGYLVEEVPVTLVDEETYMKEFDQYKARQKATRLC